MRAKSKKTRPRGKARATTKPRASKKPAANKSKLAAASKPPKAKPKRRPVKPRRPRDKAVAPPRIDAVPEDRPDLAADPTAVAADATADDSSGAAKKPGALARLKSGVGSLFARMTGRGAKGASQDSDGVPDDDRALEIVTADIIVERDRSPDD